MLKMMKQINNTRIWIEGNWYEAITTEGLFVGKGSIEDGTTHEEIYKELYSTKLFKIKGETVWTLDTLTEVYGEEADLKRRLAKAYKCKQEDVKIEIEYPSI